MAGPVACMMFGRSVGLAGSVTYWYRGIGDTHPQHTARQPQLRPSTAVMRRPRRDAGVRWISRYNRNTPVHSNAHLHPIITILPDSHQISRQGWLVRRSSRRLPQQQQGLLLGHSHPATPRFDATNPSLVHCVDSLARLSVSPGTPRTPASPHDPLAALAETWVRRSGCAVGLGRSAGNFPRTPCRVPISTPHTSSAPLRGVRWQPWQRPRCNPRPRVTRPPLQ